MNTICTNCFHDCAVIQGENGTAISICCNAEITVMPSMPTHTDLENRNQQIKIEILKLKSEYMSNRAKILQMNLSV